MGFILFLISVVIVSLLFVFSVLSQIIYFLVTFKFRSGLNQVDSFFKSMAISMDRFGNNSCAFFLNLTMVKKGGELHGDSLNVASYIIGRNHYKNKLTRFGRFIVRILNKLEANHINIAIHQRKEDDRLASERYKRNEYFKK